jgi:mannose-1-phosphate guanylyltransferase
MNYASRSRGGDGLTVGGTALERDQKRWAIILAGGDRNRLQDLTRFISGDDRPKQFCPIIDNDTRLLALRAPDLGWSDLGHPQRVLTALDEWGSRPSWMNAWREAKSANAVVSEQVTSAVA